MFLACSRRSVFQIMLIYTLEFFSRKTNNDPEQTDVALNGDPPCQVRGVEIYYSEGI